MWWRICSIRRARSISREGYDLKGAKALRRSVARPFVLFRESGSWCLFEHMITELLLRFRVMRRRARLFPRQIVLAVVLSALAAGFVASARWGDSPSHADGDRRMSTLTP